MPPISGRVTVDKYSLILSRGKRLIRINPGASSGTTVASVSILFAKTGSDADRSVYDAENSSLDLRADWEDFEAFHSVLRTGAPVVVDWSQTSADPGLATPVSFELQASDPLGGVPVGRAPDTTQRTPQTLRVDNGGVIILRQGEEFLNGGVIILLGPEKRTSKDPLCALLVELGADPQKVEQFSADPQAVMRHAGLSPEDITLMMTRDPGKIRQALETRGCGEYALCFLGLLNHQGGNS